MVLVGHNACTYMDIEARVSSFFLISNDACPTSREVTENWFFGLPKQIYFAASMQQFDIWYHAPTR